MIPIPIQMRLASAAGGLIARIIVPRAESTTTTLESRTTLLSLAFGLRIFLYRSHEHIAPMVSINRSVVDMTAASTITAKTAQRARMGSEYWMP